MTAAASAPIPSSEAISAGWTDRHVASVMGTYGPPRRVLVRGQGCWVWDADDNRYLDLLGGIAVNALGHAHPALVHAVTEQWQTLGHISNFFASPPQIALAERLLALTGAPDGRVFLCNSGTEANEVAFKVARRTGRPRIVATQTGFHGRSMGALALTGKEAIRTPFQPLPGGVEHVPFGDVDALRAAIDDTCAAVVLEVIQGEAGVRPAPVGYLEEARRLTREHGALLILDEVQTGVGRTGHWFAYQQYDLQPDLITLAKGLGGGFPVGACIGLGEAAALLGTGDHGSTFGGNPPAAAAALAVLDTIAADGLLGRATQAGALLRDGLSDVHPWVTEVRGSGLLIGIGLSQPCASALAAECLHRGLIVNDVAPDTLRLAPPLILTDDQIALAIAGIGAALAAVSGVEARHPLPAQPDPLHPEQRGQS